MRNERLYKQNVLSHTAGMYLFKAILTECLCYTGSNSCYIPDKHHKWFGNNCLVIPDIYQLVKTWDDMEIHQDSFNRHFTSWKQVCWCQRQFDHFWKISLHTIVKFFIVDHFAIWSGGLIPFSRSRGISGVAIFFVQQTPSDLSFPLLTTFLPDPNRSQLLL